MIYYGSREPHQQTPLTEADTLCREGIADEELARKEAERGRKRKLDEDDLINGSRKWSRSISSYSTNSVSTISTNLSRSPSPKLAGEDHTGHSQLLSHLEVDRKRRRGRSSSMSYTSDSSHGARRRDRPRDMVRDSIQKQTPQQGKRATDGQWRRHARARSTSYTAESSPEKTRLRPSHIQDRSKRRRHSSRSPIDRGRDSFSNRGSRRTRSPSESRDRSQVIRNRKSMTPGLSRRNDEHLPPSNRGESYYSRDNDRYGSSVRDQQEDMRETRLPADALPSWKERSLSPFSKRLALTQAMNMGR